MKKEKTFLVIEDEPIIAKLHMQLLEQAGFDTLHVKNFQQFMLVLSETKQEIVGIITDDEIPPKEGETPSAYAKIIIQTCLEKGMKEDNICLSSGTLCEALEHPLITVIPKKNGYISSLRKFIVSFAEKVGSKK